MLKREEKRKGRGREQRIEGRGREGGTVRGREGGGGGEEEGGGKERYEWSSNIKRINKGEKRT